MKIKGEGRFTDALHLLKQHGQKIFTVGKSFKYHVGLVCHVPVNEGFKTNLASVPPLARVLIPQIGRFDQAAVVHDWLYQMQYVVLLSGEKKRVTRKEADDIFLAAMKDSGVRKTRRYAIYAGVRVGGWLYWKDCSDCDK